MFLMLMLMLMLLIMMMVKMMVMMMTILSRQVKALCRLEKLLLAAALVTGISTTSGFLYWCYLLV